MTTKIALIWGYNHDLKNPYYSTHHGFWEETIKDRSDLSLTRYTWENWRTMPLGYDLYLFVDYHDSLYHLEETPYHPRAFYWWDCFHKPFSYVAQVTEIFDHSYLAENLSASTLRSQGFPVSWLPPAYYPGLYRPIPETTKLYDFGFVGQADMVVSRKGLTRWGFLEKVSSLGLPGYLGRDVIGETVNLIYNQSRILFDRTIFNNVGTRFFETIGSGGFLLMNQTKGYNGIDQLACNGIHYVSYDDSFQDFQAKLKYYLAHQDEAKQIASQGQVHFQKCHTYNNRLNVILKDFQLLK